MTSSVQTKRIHFSALLSLFCSLAVTYVVLLIVSKTVQFPIDENELVRLFAVPGLFAPEPLENALFLSGIVIMPVLLLLFYLAFRTLLSRYPRSSFFYEKTCPQINAVIVVLGCILLFYVITRGDEYFLSSGLGTWPVSLLVTSIASFFFYRALINPDSVRSFPTLKKIIRYTLVLSAIIAMIAAFGYGLFSEYTVNESAPEAGIYNYHFNAVFHAVVQVYLGKELLVDLSHMYGLYPHFIEPIFRITGLSVFRFTFLMGLLLALSFNFIFLVLTGITRSRVIGLLGFIAVVYYSYFFGRILSHDPYFQFHPIRLLFPTLQIYLTYRYFLDKNGKSYYLAWLASSISVLWNFDTGVAVLGAWLLVLCYDELCKLNFKAPALHMIKGLTVFLSVLFLFTVYLSLRYGHIPDYARFLVFQRTYYAYGLCMLPMPLVHAWNLVLLIYAVGILYAIVPMVENETSLKTTMVFFLSILGTGMFVYYQGRSADSNLATICFPAIMIITIFADHLLSSLPASGKSRAIIVYVVLFFLVFSTAGFIVNVPDIVRTIFGRMKPALEHASTPVTRTIDFVKQNTTEGQEVLILSELSSIYYLKSRTTCPVKIPGPTEIYLLEDCRRIINYLEHSKGNTVLLDTNFQYAYSRELTSRIRAVLWQQYHMEHNSPDGNMSVFTKQ